MADAPVVIVTSRSFSSGAYDAQAALESVGAEVLQLEADHNTQSVADALPRATAWIAGTAPIAEKHLAGAPKLRIIARYGVGVDSVDLDAAGRRGIFVTNTPDANSSAVADHALALMLAALRDIPAGDRRVRSGDWTVTRTRELGEVTVGILGLGRIGRAVARRLSGFGPRMIGHDPWVPDEQIRELGIEPVDRDDLAHLADIVTVHAPGTETVITADWLGQAKPGIILINTARANLVDEYAVADALRSGTLRGYATDTLSTEAYGESSPLLDPALSSSTIFSPHVGAQTQEAVDRMGRGAVESVLAFFRGELPPNVVNTPELLLDSKGL